MAISKKEGRAIAERIAEATKGLQVPDASQALVLPFAPYQTQEYGATYSETLVAKANEHADKKWGSQERYEYARLQFPALPSLDELDLRQEDSKIFAKYQIDNVLWRVFGLNYNQTTNGLPAVHNVITKVKKLEKTRDVDDYFLDGVRERIINCILLPVQNFAPADSVEYGSGWLKFSYQGTRAEASGELSSEDVTMICNMLDYIPRVRRALKSFSVREPMKLVQAELLLPIIDAKMQSENKIFNPGPSSRELEIPHRLLAMKQFLERAVPNQMVQDNIPGLQYPNQEYIGFGKLSLASTHLRDTVTGFITERYGLAELLEAIQRLEQELLGYFRSVTAVIELYLNFLHRIGTTYTKLVEESAGALEIDDIPF